ncbi:MAG: hypothetical protein WCG29_10800 [Desulfomonile sp.]|jgi:hypothetical protein
MKQLLRTILIALLLTAVGIQTSAAQYYYNYYPHNYGSGTVHPGYAPARGRAPAIPFRYRLTPKPGVYWKWNQYNRFSEYQNFLRSPLNPESDLDYLMRTF